MKELRGETFQEEPFFESKTFLFHDSKGREIEKDVVIVKDIMVYLHHLHEKRGLSIQETVLKIGLDFGGGSLKVCMSILPKVEESTAPKGDHNPNSVKALVFLAVGR